MSMKVESAEHSSPELQHNVEVPDTGSNDARRPTNRTARRQAASKTARKEIRKEARKVPYLSLREGRYYFMRRYPVRLCRRGCVTEPVYRVSLKTADRLCAERLARKEAYRFDRLVDELDRKCELPHAAPQRVVDAAVVLADDVPVVARRFEALLLYSDDLDRGEKLSAAEFEEYSGELNTQRSQLRVANGRGDYDAVAEDARGFLEAEKLKCDEGSDTWKSLLKEMMLAQLRALRGIADRLDGETIPPADSAKAPAPLRSEDDLDDLDRAFDHWQTKNRPKAKTVIEAKAVWARLKSFTGKSRVSTLTRIDMLGFQSNEGKRMVGGKPIRPQTVNKLMGLLRAIIGLAVDDLLREREIVSPLEKLRKDKVKPGDVTEKQDLSEEQLKTFFRGPVHAQGERPIGGAGEAAYWLPTLVHITGARMAELAQLSVHEVVVRDGIVCLWVTARDNNEQAALHQLSTKAREELFESSLKTGASRRIIPVHPRVLELGFMEYVEYVRRSGSFALFPDMRPDDKGNIAGNYSKWFNRYLKRVRIKARGVDWISFRHTLKTWMRDAQIHPDVQDYIQGHTATRVSQTYGRFPPKTVLAELSKLSFPALDDVPKWTPGMMRGRA
jgi:integrase